MVVQTGQRYPAAYEPPASIVVQFHFFDVSKLEFLVGEYGVLVVLFCVLFCCGGVGMGEILSGGQRGRVRKCESKDAQQWWY